MIFFFKKKLLEESKKIFQITNDLWPPNFTGNWTLGKTLLKKAIQFKYTKRLADFLFFILNASYVLIMWIILLLFFFVFFLKNPSRIYNPNDNHKQWCSCSWVCVFHKDNIPFLMSTKWLAMRIFELKYQEAVKELLSLNWIELNCKNQL